MSSTDPNLGLTYNWAIGANVKTDMDANIKKLGAVIQLSVLAIANDPPVSPASGDRYIVGVGTGAWLTHDDKIAVRVAGAWEFYAPATGWWAYNATTDTYWKFDVTWAEYAGGVALLSDADPLSDSATAAPGVGTTASRADHRHPKPKRTIAAAAPTVNDDETAGYSAWSLWADTSGAQPEVYRCLDAATGAAVWALTTLTIDELGTAATADKGLAAGNVLQADQTEASTATATTLALGTATTRHLLTGTTTVTGFTGTAGVMYTCRADGAFLLTHHATNLIITQTGASITTAAGDTFDVLMITGNTARVVNYIRASGMATQAANAVAITGGSAVVDSLEVAGQNIRLFAKGGSGAPSAAVALAFSDAGLGANRNIFAIQHRTAAGEFVKNVLGVDLDNSRVGVGTANPSSALQASTARLGNSSISTEVELNYWGTGDRTSFIDFHSAGDPATADYHARIIRNAGVDGTFELKNTGGGVVSTWVNNSARTVVTDAAFRPASDNAYSCGTSGNRWSVVYAGTGTINTSDAREKTEVQALTTAERAAAKQLAKEIGTYQFLASVAEKGAAARVHVGMTVQRAITVMEQHGLDPYRYGFICYDKWDAETQEVETIEGDGEPREIKVEQTRTETTTEIQVIDGQPTLVAKEIKVPVTTEVPVLHPDGSPVLTTYTTEDGETITEALTHTMPVMDVVTKYYKQEVTREAGDRFSFRPDQLALFIAAGLVV